MIRITAKINGFRRCGTAHYGVCEYLDDHWTPDQLEILESDPMLVVERLPNEMSADEPDKDAIASREAEQAGVSPAPRVCLDGQGETPEAPETPETKPNKAKKK